MLVTGCCCQLLLETLLLLNFDSVCGLGLYTKYWLISSGSHSKAHEVEAHILLGLRAQTWLDTFQSIPSQTYHRTHLDSQREKNTNNCDHP